MASGKGHDGVSGGYDSDFVDSVPKDLECPVCLQALRDPMILSCCGAKMCSGCIGPVKLANHPCPLCQDAVFDTMLEKALRRKVLDLLVRCPKNVEGCQWIGELRCLEKHISLSEGDCQFVDVQCRYNCGGWFQRKCLQEHELNHCSKRPVEVQILRLHEKYNLESRQLKVKVAELENELALIQLSKNSQEDMGTKLQNLHEQVQKMVLLYEQQEQQTKNEVARSMEERKQMQKKHELELQELRAIVAEQAKELALFREVKSEVRKMASKQHKQQKEVITSLEEKQNQIEALSTKLEKRDQEFLVLKNTIEEQGKMLAQQLQHKTKAPTGQSFTHVVDPIVDPRISQLSMQTIEYLEKVAREHKVEIDIDQEEALHTIELRGCQNNVLAVKDKVRDAVVAVSREETKADAADAIFATVRWTRLLSGEDMDDYDPLTNYEIEQAYRMKQGWYKCERDFQNFVVNFSTFQETDFHASEVVTVKRRDLIKEYSSIRKPEEWDPMPTDSSGNGLLVHLVTLQPGSKEYQMVETKFKATLSGKTLFTIERLQNPVLYGQYITLKKQMDKRNPLGYQNERWLFHGTSPDACSKINTLGFNRSFMEKNGTAYGNGVYFARDASYFHCYAAADGQGKRRMYFTRVLSGQSTIGKSGMILPPPKNPQLDPNLPFDSTVDNVSNPSIVVVYNDSQSYPAYLITYS